ncbi:unnamed protein product [Vitrella brassicaformis CCMP3155]|uniref:Uncharacterized protein n=6 Tax=Vitrella brassicaformis TaxID=1169539 RepID=A0A0G4EC15_VITBC|nr:unnamed protein product [Vitrella brassicaformis CCMP3155]|eukprot:CEL92865.1 unnamed protein product [Vitrella brassicaformis CCMP3155]
MSGSLDQFDEDDDTERRKAVEMLGEPPGDDSERIDPSPRTLSSSQNATNQYNRTQEDDAASSLVVPPDLTAQPDDSACWSPEGRWRQQWARNGEIEDFSPHQRASAAAASAAVGGGVGRIVSSPGPPGAFRGQQGIASVGGGGVGVGWEGTASARREESPPPIRQPSGNNLSLVPRGEPPHRSVSFLGGVTSNIVEDHARMNADLSRLRAAFEATKTSEAALSVQVGDLMAAKTRAENDAHNAERRLEQLIKAQGRGFSYNSWLEKENSGLQGEVTNLRIQVEELLEQLSRQNTWHEEHAAVLAKEVADHTTRIAVSQELHNNKDGEIAVLRRDIEELNQRHRQQLQQVEGHASDLDSHNQQLQRTLADTKRQLDDTSLQLTTLRQRHDDNAALVQENDRLKKCNNGLQEELLSLRKIQTRNKGGMLRPVGDIVDRNGGEWVSTAEVDVIVELEREKMHQRVADLRAELDTTKAALMQLQYPVHPPTPPASTHRPTALTVDSWTLTDVTGDIRSLAERNSDVGEAVEGVRHLMATEITDLRKQLEEKTTALQEMDQLKRQAESTVDELLQNSRLDQEAYAQQALKLQQDAEERIQHERQLLRLKESELVAAHEEVQVLKRHVAVKTPPSPLPARDRHDTPCQTMPLPQPQQQQQHHTASQTEAPAPLCDSTVQTEGWSGASLHPMLSKVVERGDVAMGIGMGSQSGDVTRTSSSTQTEGEERERKREETAGSHSQDLEDRNKQLEAEARELRHFLEEVQSNFLSLSKPSLADSATQTPPPTLASHTPPPISIAPQPRAPTHSSSAQTASHRPPLRSASVQAAPDPPHLSICVETSLHHPPSRPHSTAVQTEGRPVRHHPLQTERLDMVERWPRGVASKGVAACPDVTHAAAQCHRDDRRRCLSVVRCVATLAIRGGNGSGGGGGGDGQDSSPSSREVQTDERGDEVGRLGERWARKYQAKKRELERALLGQRDRERAVQSIEAVRDSYSSLVSRSVTNSTPRSHLSLSDAPPLPLPLPPASARSRHSNKANTEDDEVESFVDLLKDIKGIGSTKKHAATRRGASVGAGVVAPLPLEREPMMAVAAGALHVRMRHVWREVREVRREVTEAKKEVAAILGSSSSRGEGGVLQWVWAKINDLASIGREYERLWRSEQQENTQLRDMLASLQAMLAAPAPHTHTDRPLPALPDPSSPMLPLSMATVSPDRVSTSRTAGRSAFSQTLWTGQVEEWVEAEAGRRANKRMTKMQQELAGLQEGVRGRVSEVERAAARDKAALAYKHKEAALQMRNRCHMKLEDMQSWLRRELDRSESRAGVLQGQLEDQVAEREQSLRRLREALEVSNTHIQQTFDQHTRDNRTLKLEYEERLAKVEAERRVEVGRAEAARRDLEGTCDALRREVDELQRQHTQIQAVYHRQLQEVRDEAKGDCERQMAADKANLEATLQQQLKDTKAHYEQLLRAKGQEAEVIEEKVAEIQTELLRQEHQHKIDLEGLTETLEKDRLASVRELERRLQEATDAHTRTRDRLQADLDKATADTESLESRVTSLQDELATVRGVRGSLEDKIHRLEADLAAAQHALAQKDIERSRDDEREGRLAHEEVQALRRQLTQREEDKRQCDQAWLAKYESMVRSQTDLDSRNRQIAQELQEARSRLEAAVDAQQSIEVTLHGTETDLQAARRECESLRALNGRQDEVIGALERRLRGYEATDEVLASELHTAMETRLKKELDDNVCQVRRDYEKRLASTQSQRDGLQQQLKTLQEAVQMLKHQTQTLTPPRSTSPQPQPQAAPPNPQQRAASLPPTANIRADQPPSSYGASFHRSRGVDERREREREMEREKAAVIKEKEREIDRLGKELRVAEARVKEIEGEKAQRDKEGKDRHTQLRSKLAALQNELDRFISAGETDIRQRKIRDEADRALKSREAEFAERLKSEKQQLVREHQQRIKKAKQEAEETVRAMQRDKEKAEADRMALFERTVDGLVDVFDTARDHLTAITAADSSAAGTSDDSVPSSSSPRLLLSRRPSPLRSSIGARAPAPFHRLLPADGSPKMLRWSLVHLTSAHRDRKARSSGNSSSSGRAESPFSSMTDDELRRVRPVLELVRQLVLVAMGEGMRWAMPLWRGRVAAYRAMLRFHRNVAHRRLRRERQKHGPPLSSGGRVGVLDTSPPSHSPFRGLSPSRGLSPPAIITEQPRQPPQPTTPPHATPPPLLSVKRREPDQTFTFARSKTPPVSRSPKRVHTSGRTSDPGSRSPIRRDGAHTVTVASLGPSVLQRVVGLQAERVVREVQRGREEAIRRCVRADVRSLPRSRTPPLRERESVPMHMVSKSRLAPRGKSVG